MGGPQVVASSANVPASHAGDVGANPTDLTITTMHPHGVGIHTFQEPLLARARRFESCPPHHFWGSEGVAEWQTRWLCIYCRYDLCVVVFHHMVVQFRRSNSW